MEKSSFLQGFEEVMGVTFTWQNFFIGLAMVVAGLVVLQVGEVVSEILSSFHWIN